MVAPLILILGLAALTCALAAIAVVIWATSRNRSATAPPQAIDPAPSSPGSEPGSGPPL